MKRLPPGRVKAIVAWTAAGPCALWALIRLLGIEGGFPLVALVAYTPEVIPIAVIAVVVALALRQWPAAALAGLASLTLVLAVAPRAVGGPDNVEGRPLRVMSANVLRGEGSAEQLLDLVRDHEVEILTVQELTPKFAAGFERAGVGQLLPHSALALRPGVVGSGIYSRYPIEPGPKGEYATQNSGTVTVEPRLKLAVLSAHPATPGSFDLWKEGLRDLPDPSSDGPVSLLLGDFNATLDHAEFRDVLDRGYADAGERMGEGLTPTWPAIDRGFGFLPVTIDHLLYDRDRAGVRDYEVMDLDGSDHRPVYAELVIER